MSLINQALRKVQNERTANRGTIRSSTPNTAYVHHNGRKNKMGLLIALGGCIAILILFVAGLILALLLKDPKPVFAEANSAEPSARQTDKAATADSLADTVKNNLDVQAGRLATPEKSVKETYTVTKSPMLVSEPKQEIIEWLSQSIISGIRISRNGSKVILNNKAFTPGEIVNSNFDLRLSEINEEKLLLVDSNGVEYIKRL